ncbi:MAG: hypothetical protein ABIP41_04400, partial [Croceibacterium sp.]
ERRMAERPGWLLSYFQASGLPADELARRATVLTELASTGTRLGCKAVEPFVAGALTAGARRPAEQVWLAHCPGAALAGGLADPGFDQLGTERVSPFGWQVPPSGDVTVEPVGGPGAGRRVQLVNRASVSRLVLVQALALPPGRYRLTAQVPAGRLTASFACGPTPPLPHFISGDPGAAGQVLDIPACEQLTMGLWLRPTTDPVALDDVALVRF